MATVTTINEQEFAYRVDQATFALFDGKRVTLQAGVFRASGTTPQQLMEQVLQGLHCLEVECGSGRLWRVFITRKVDYSFVLEARCFG